MRKYTTGNRECLAEVRCNQCGRSLKVENGIMKEGCFSGEERFGYFSKKDGVTHRFDLCESCYDRLLHSFVIPAEEIEETELC